MADRTFKFKSTKHFTFCPFCRLALSRPCLVVKSVSTLPMFVHLRLNSVLVVSAGTGDEYKSHPSVSTVLLSVPVTLNRSTQTEVAAFSGLLACRKMTVPAIEEGNFAMAVICDSFDSNVAQTIALASVVSVRTTDLPTKQEYKHWFNVAYN